LAGWIDNPHECVSPVIDGEVDLRDCRARVIHYYFRPAATWLKGELPDWPVTKLKGCTFDDLSLPAAGYHELPALLAADDLDRGTYTAIERWLREHEQEEPAQAVYLAQRHRARAAKLKQEGSWWERFLGFAGWVGDHIVEQTTLYGQRSWRLLWL